MDHKVVQISCVLGLLFLTVSCEENVPSSAASPSLNGTTITPSAGGSWANVNKFINHRVSNVDTLNCPSGSSYSTTLNKCVRTFVSASSDVG